jgi:hypothetical protein
VRRASHPVPASGLVQREKRHLAIVGEDPEKTIVSGSRAITSSG